MKTTYRRAVDAMLNRETFISSKEKQFGNARQGGCYQDEVSPWEIQRDGQTFKGSVWFYHGHPIAALFSGLWFYSSAGYKTITTKARLNAAGAMINQRNGEWFVMKRPFQDADLPYILGIKTYHKIDGWRGYTIPALAVAGVSDTGTWSDSPARSDDGQREISRLRNVLKSRGINTYLAWTCTSNVFCIKQWVMVRGVKYFEAKSIAQDFIDREGDNLRLLHNTD